MHIHIVPNRGSRPTILLRESYREGKKVKKRTIANLSHLPMPQIELLRAVFQGADLQPAGLGFVVERSQPHGHVEAVQRMMARLGLASLISAKPCRERDIVLALIASRILSPHTKLATTRWWHTTTLADEGGVADVDEQDCYAAMDWLLTRQDRIQKKLAARHLKADGLVLYDLSSSYFEGTTSHAAGNACPLARRGYSRDGRRGTLQVNYGLMTDDRGCPVAVSVHEGNVADPTTLMPEIARIKDEFGIAQFVMVGDRGMISSTAIATLRDHGGIDWITALKSTAIRALVEDKTIQPDLSLPAAWLVDETNLCEITHPDYPGERLVACRNPELAKLRAHKREELLQATEEALRTIQTRVEAGRLTGQDKIGLAVGRVVNRYQRPKHFTLTLTDTTLTFARKEDAIAAEAALDGIYIIRTSVKAERLDSASCVRHYQSLSQVERAFRSLKTVDLKVRPIHHRLSDRALPAAWPVRAHIFLCMLAYYVEWHLKEAWRELLFTDEDQAAKTTRDPVAPAERSAGAKAKIARRHHADGTPIHSFQTLLTELATIVRNTCCTSAEDDAPTFTVTTRPNPLQARAMELIDTLAV
ncbi:transposase [Acidiferrobacter sp. SPIII_3]|uniref:IS1634 family transposase n=1 Tax=Acidiferrobacter sp. SPIII_3 TaxID=1281578 RepID=UPI000D72B665|nr:IS1634 family transposase [Acidiferrobacter sp. SPIII_3]AWP21986.1 transposase [Acidiferrobacter sp. SPIII_3]